MTKDNQEKRSFKPVFRLFVQIVVLGYVLLFIFQRWEQFRGLLDVGLLDGLFIASLLIVELFVQTWLLRIMVKSQGNSLSFSDSLILINGTRLLNLLPMNLGTIVKARALKKNVNLKYTCFVSLMSANLLVTVITGGLTGILLLLTYESIFKSGILIVLLFFSLAVIVPALLFFIPHSAIPKGKNRFFQVLRELIEGVNLLRKNRFIISAMISCAIIQQLSSGLRLWICFNALKTDVGLPGSIVFSLFSGMIMVANVIPQSSGVREILISAQAQFMGFEFQTALFSASLSGFFLLAAVILLGLPSIYSRKWRALND